MTDEYANPRRPSNTLHGIEYLTVKRIERRPMLLLRGEVVTASGGQRERPPLASGDEKQNGNENRVRRKEKRYLLSGKHGVQAMRVAR